MIPSKCPIRLIDEWNAPSLYIHNIKYNFLVNMKICMKCQLSFDVTDTDLAFYDSISPMIAGKKYAIPEPTLCPDCRQQRRLCWRNERNLYHRKCDLTGKQVLSLYSPDRPYTIYAQEEWWSDRWDPLDYGRDFDFTRPFFDQFADLMKAVPRSASFQTNNENSDYSPWIIDSKNCYLCSGGRYNEDCLYCMFPTRSTGCIDCTIPTRSEYCYECVDVLSSYECFFSVYLENCSNCSFCFDLVGCRDCFGCAGLKNKQYCIFNQQYTQEEYKMQMKQFAFSNSDHLVAVKNKVNEFLLGVPKRNLRMINCENSLGDVLRNCKNVQFSFDVEDAEDGKYLYDIRGTKNCYDMYIGGFKSELCYEGISILDNFMTAFSAFLWESCSNCYFSNECISSNNLFGCIGLRHEKYCILNKQYSQEEYFQILPRIIEHMKKAKEWGEYFPASIAPFAYNQTVAQEYYPLSREEVENNGWNYFEDQNKAVYQGPEYIPPQDISEVPDSITEKILSCEVTGRPYKILKQELHYYQKHNLPIPRKCPDQRHEERLALRNPRKLWTRECDKCKKGIDTTYSPKRTEKVYCEHCYLKELY